jgi:hypothetical protein
LIRTLSNHKTHNVRVAPITPKSLLLALVRSHPTWLWSIFKERWRIARSGRVLREAVQDASREFWT